MTAAVVASPGAQPSRNSITALISSPVSSLGTPNTAASPTAGCCTRAPSISAG